MTYFCEECSPMTHERGLRHVMSRNYRPLAVLLIALSLLGVVVGCSAEEPKVRHDSQRLATEKVQKDYGPLIAPHLEKAKKETDQAIEKTLFEIAQLFEAAKQGTRGFAEVALGWGSKWRYLEDRLPWTDGTKHRQYLEDNFRKMVLDCNDFANSLNSILRLLQKEVEDIEGRMLVALRADLPDLPPSHPFHRWDDARWHKEFRAAIDAAEKKAKDEVAVTIGREVCVGILSELSTLVMRQLLASAGILSLGGALAPETLGLSLVIGLIVDHIVSWVLDKVYDPAGGLALELNRKLDQLRNQVIKGTDQELGLRSVLEQMSQHRNKLRREAIIQLLKDNQ